MNDFLKRTWAVINLDSLYYNISEIKNQLPKKTKIMAVVKADAYGHGDKYIAKALADYGIDFFAVSNLEEALSLRRAGITANILILGFTPAKNAAELSRFNISQTVFSEEYANELSDCCVKANCSVDVHVKLDTGMGRIGFIESDVHHANSAVHMIDKLPNINIKGIFTHLSSADSLDQDSVDYTKKQVEYFNNAVQKLISDGLNLPFIHIQNSAGIVFPPDKSSVCYSHARAGIIMYGLAPSNEKLSIDVKPLMELKSVISMVKTVDAGVAISYNRKYTSKKEIKVATVPIGYADGYPRLLSNKGAMLIHGKKAAIIGNICMDQLMLDVSDIENVKAGDVVTVVGKDGDEEITFWELANTIGTISYELMCLIGRRVPRVYIKNDKAIDVVDYVSGDISK